MVVCRVHAPEYIGPRAGAQGENLRSRRSATRSDLDRLLGQGRSPKLTFRKFSDYAELSAHADEGFDGPVQMRALVNR